MKNLIFSLLIAISFISFTSNAQLTAAWTGANGNIVANNAIGGVSFSNYQGGSIMLQGGIQNSLGLFVTGIPEASAPETFSAYPNPSTGLFYVHVPDNVTLQVYSLQGQLVHTAVGGQVDITNLSPGSYIVGAQGYKSSMIIKH